MKPFLISLFAVFLTFAFATHDAEARRLGGGKSFGMQRSAPAKQEATPAPQRPQAASTPAPATPQKRSWMGPIAGLAAGLGLAALASHFGFGEGMANFLMLALLAMAAFMLFRFLMRRSAPPTPVMQYAGMPASAMNPASSGFEQTPAAAFGGPAHPFPPGFDAEAFVREAKLNFIRLQAANDSGRLDEVREFTTDELFEELKQDIRGNQQTDVVSLQADLLELATEGERHWASVRFYGTIRESAGEAPAQFEEVWNLVKPASGATGWLLAGIQQMH